MKSDFTNTDDYINKTITQRFPKRHFSSLWSQQPMDKGALHIEISNKWQPFEKWCLHRIILQCTKFSFQNGGLGKDFVLPDFLINCSGLHRRRVIGQSSNEIHKHVIAAEKKRIASHTN